MGCDELTGRFIQGRAPQAMFNIAILNTPNAPRLTTAQATALNGVLDRIQPPATQPGNR